jgi:hypothetical protein
MVSVAENICELSGKLYGNFQSLEGVGGVGGFSVTVRLA